MRGDNPSVVIGEVRVWYDSMGHIHLTNGEFITTVNADPVSKRGHPHLYNHLAACLKGAGVESPQA